jgi:hypothetical protein
LEEFHRLGLSIIKVHLLQAAGRRGDEHAVVWRRAAQLSGVNAEGRRAAAILLPPSAMSPHAYVQRLASPSQRSRKATFIY